MQKLHFLSSCQYTHGCCVLASWPHHTLYVLIQDLIGFSHENHSDGKHFVILAVYELKNRLFSWAYISSGKALMPVLQTISMKEYVYMLLNLSLMSILLHRPIQAVY